MQQCTEPADYYQIQNWKKNNITNLRLKFEIKKDPINNFSFVNFHRMKKFQKNPCARRFFGTFTRKPTTFQFPTGWNPSFPWLTTHRRRNAPKGMMRPYAAEKSSPGRSPRIDGGIHRECTRSGSSSRNTHGNNYWWTGNGNWILHGVTGHSPRRPGQPTRPVSAPIMWKKRIRIVCFRYSIIWFIPWSKKIILRRETRTRGKTAGTPAAVRQYPYGGRSPWSWWRYDRDFPGPPAGSSTDGITRWRSCGGSYAEWCPPAHNV